MKDHGHPNWMFWIFIGISTVVHLFIILCGNDLYHPEIITPIELTIRYIEPPKRTIPSPPVPPQLPIVPVPVSRVTVSPEPVKAVHAVKASPIRQPFSPKMKKNVTPPKPEPLRAPEQTASECVTDSIPKEDSKIDIPATRASIGAGSESVVDKDLKSATTVEVKQDPAARENYLSTIRQLIERQKKYPQVARLRQFQGKVVVEFVLTPSGDVNSIRVVEECRFSILNRAAIQSVEAASPFPKPPDGLFRGDYPLRIPIVFELS